MSAAAARFPSGAAATAAARAAHLLTTAALAALHIAALLRRGTGLAMVFQLIPIIELLSAFTTELLGSL